MVADEVGVNMVLAQRLELTESIIYLFPCTWWDGIRQQLYASTEGLYPNNDPKEMLKTADK